MKFFMMLLISLFFWSADLKAEGQNSDAMIEVMTLTTCEQHDGNPWKSIGIVEDAAGLRVIIVESDEDNDTTILKASFVVTKEDEGYATSFKDAQGFFELSIETYGGNALGIAELQFSADNGITFEIIEPMYCYAHVPLGYSVPE